MVQEGVEPTTLPLSGVRSNQLSYCTIKLKRIKGIEPSPNDWKSPILPLNYIRMEPSEWTFTTVDNMFSIWLLGMIIIKGGNGIWTHESWFCRPEPYHLAIPPLIINLARAVGFKPTPNGFGDRYAIVTPYPYGWGSRIWTYASWIQSPLPYAAWLFPNILYFYNIIIIFYCQIFFFFFNNFLFLHIFNLFFVHNI